MTDACWNMDQKEIFVETRKERKGQRPMMTKNYLKNLGAGPIFEDFFGIVNSFFRKEMLFGQ